MDSMTQEEPLVVADVDSRADRNLVAALDACGGSWDAFAPTTSGYRQLVAGLSGFGIVEAVESTGSDAAGLMRCLPTPSTSRIGQSTACARAPAGGAKSNPIDAEMAARLFFAATLRIPRKPEVRDRIPRSADRGPRRRNREQRELDQLVATAASRTTQLLGITTGTGSCSSPPDRTSTSSGATASFTALCGSSPIQASSSKTTRHRLSYGGDRQANRPYT